MAFNPSPFPAITSPPAITPTLNKQSTPSASSQASKAAAAAALDQEGTLESPNTLHILTSSAPTAASTSVTATAKPASTNVVNTGQTIASQLAAGGTVTGAVIVGANGQVLNAGPGGSYSPGGPSYSSLTPAQVSAISSGAGLSTAATTTAQAASISSPFAASNFGLGQSSLGMATSAFLNSGFGLGNSQSATGASGTPGISFSGNNLDYAAFGSATAPTVIFSDIPGQENEFVGTYTLNGQKIIYGGTVPYTTGQSQQEKLNSAVDLAYNAINNTQVSPLPNGAKQTSLINLNLNTFGVPGTNAYSGGGYQLSVAPPLASTSQLGLNPLIAQFQNAAQNYFATPRVAGVPLTAQQQAVVNAIYAGGNQLPGIAGQLEAPFTPYVAGGYLYNNLTPQQQAAVNALGLSSQGASQSSSQPLSYDAVQALNSPQNLQAVLSNLGQMPPSAFSNIPPYLRPVVGDITNAGTNLLSYLYGAQNFINQQAATPYNPGNPLSLPYYQNTFGNFAKDIENIPSYIANPGAALQRVATTENTINQLQNQGALPWYFGDVANGLIGLPLLATGIGAAPEIGTLLNILYGAGGNAGIGELYSYLTGKGNGLTAQGALGNLITGGEVGGFLSPLSNIAQPTIAAYGFPKVAAGLADEIENPLLAQITSKAVGAIPAAGQEAINIGQYFAALTFAQSLENGVVPSVADLAKAYTYGAALGGTMGIGTGLATGLGAGLSAYEGLGTALPAAARVGTTLGLSGAAAAGAGAAFGSPLTPTENFALGAALPIIPSLAGTGFDAARYAMEQDLTGTALGNKLGINTQILESPPYLEPPIQTAAPSSDIFNVNPNFQGQQTMPNTEEIQASGTPQNRVQYVGGHTTADGTYVPGYYREYSPLVGQEARQEPVMITYGNRNPIAADLSLEPLTEQIRESEQVPKGSSYHISPYSQAMQQQIQSGLFVVNPDYATGQNLAPGVLPFVDAEGNIKFEITSEGRGSYQGRSRGLYNSNPVVQTYSDNLVNQVVKPVVEYDAQGKPVNVNFVYGSYGFGGTNEEEATKGVLENPNKALAIKTPATTESASGLPTSLYTFDQFTKDTGITLDDLNNNYQQVKDLYETKAAQLGKPALALENVRGGQYGENQRIYAPQTPIETLPQSTTKLVFRAPQAGFFAGIPGVEDVLAPYKSLEVTSGQPQGFLPQQRNIALSGEADYLRQRGTVIVNTEKGIPVFLEDNGKYGLPGGFVSPTQENIAAGTARELAEEIGLTAQSLKPEFSYLGTPTKFFQTPNFFQDDYKVFSTTAPSTDIDTSADTHGELHGIQYIDPTKPLPDNLNENSRAVLEQYINPTSVSQFRPIDAEELTYQPPAPLPAQTSLDEALRLNSESASAGGSSIYSSGIPYSSLISPLGYASPSRGTSQRYGYVSPYGSIGSSVVPSPSPAPRVSPSRSIVPSMTPSPYLSPYSPVSPYLSPYNSPVSISPYPYPYEYSPSPYRKQYTNSPTLTPLELAKLAYQQQILRQNERQNVARIYSPSLVTRLFTQTEKLAEKLYAQPGYAELFSSVGLRPQQIPASAANLPLIPNYSGNATPIPTGITQTASPSPLSLQSISNPVTTSSTANPITLSTPSTQLSAVATPTQAVSFSAGNPIGQTVGIIPDPSTMTVISNPALASGPSLVSSPGQTTPASPFNAEQLAELSNAVSQIAPPPAPVSTNFISAIEGTGLQTLNTPSVGPITSLSNSSFGNPIPITSPPVQFSSAGIGRSYLPTGQVLASVIGYEPLLRLLNQINPYKYSAQAIQFSPQQLLQQINGLDYQTIMAIWSMLTVQQRANILLAEGYVKDYADAIEIAQGYNVFAPPDYQPSQARKKVEEPVSNEEMEMVSV